MDHGKITPEKAAHFFLWKTLASMAPEVVSWPILLRNFVLASSPTRLAAIDIELERERERTIKDNHKYRKLLSFHPAVNQAYPN